MLFQMCEASWMQWRGRAPGLPARCRIRTTVALPLSVRFTTSPFTAVVVGATVSVMRFNWNEYRQHREDAKDVLLALGWQCTLERFTRKPWDDCSHWDKKQCNERRWHGHVNLRGYNRPQLIRRKSKWCRCECHGK